MYIILIQALQSIYIYVYIPNSGLTKSVNIYIYVYNPNSGLKKFISIYIILYLYLIQV